jgi:hypothetical protein
LEFGPDGFDFRFQGLLDFEDGLVGHPLEAGAAVVVVVIVITVAVAVAMVVVVAAVAVIMIAVVVHVPGHLHHRFGKVVEAEVYGAELCFELLKLLGERRVAGGPSGFDGRGRFAQLYDERLVQLRRQADHLIVHGNGLLEGGGLFFAAAGKEDGQNGQRQERFHDGVDFLGSAGGTGS